MSWDAPPEVKASADSSAPAEADLARRTEVASTRRPFIRREWSAHVGAGDPCELDLGTFVAIDGWARDALRPSRPSI